MSVASRITSMTEHIQNAYDSIERFGVDTESIDKNLVNLSNTITNEIYDKLPKVSGNGSNFTLENAQNGKLDLFEMEGNTIQGRLPSEYTQVDYIESSGTQYIDTGVNADSNLRVVLDIAYTSPTISNQNIGAIILTPSTLRYHLLSTQTSFKMYSYTSDVIVGDVDTNRHLFDFDIPNRKVYFDGNEFDKPSNDFDLGINFYLFGRNSTGSIYLSKVKQWACKMYYNNVLVRDFIPCYRNSDNEVGLYDLVNDVFYTNQGIGVFTYGAIAPTPDSTIDIEIVENKQLVNVRSNQLLDYTDTYNISNETYVFENDILTLNQTPNTTYAFLTYRITELIKNNPGKEVKFSYENIDLSNFNSPNNTIVQMRINKGSTDEYIRLLYKNLTQETYVIPNDTSDIVYVNLGIFTNNSSTSLTSSKLVITKPLLYFDNNNEYSKYHNQDYEIDLHGKNLFDKDNANILNVTFNSTNPIILDSANSRTVYIPCKTNTTYTIQKIKGKRFAVGYTKEIPAINVLTYGTIGGNSTAEYYTITTDDEAKYLVAFITNLNEDLELTEQQILDSIQIEENSTPTELEEFYDYKFCKIEDYKDAIFKNNQLSEYYDSTLDEDVWYKKKYITKSIFDNSFDKIDYIVEKTTTIRFDFRNILANSLSINANKIICNKFVCLYGNDTDIEHCRNLGISYINTFSFYLNKSRLSDISTTQNITNSLRTWLSTNNITIYYVLNTPTYEKITNSTLISQLEAIETETGTNIFEVSNENNVLPSLNVKRLKELEKLS